MKRARIVVTGICSSGWFTSSLSLAGWARARESLERCEVLFVSLVGDLA